MDIDISIDTKLNILFVFGFVSIFVIYFKR
jgi:hypothetical protein